MLQEEPFSLLYFRILLTVCQIVCFSPPTGTEKTALMCDMQTNTFIPEPLCFLLRDIRMQYVAAQNACATLNEGRLINMQSEGKYMIFDALRNIFASNMDGMDYWLGLVKTPGSGDWKWSDPNQSPMVYNKWKTGEPKWSDLMATVTFAYTSDFWISTHVLDEHFMFCEYSPVSAGPATLPSPSPWTSAFPSPGLHPQFQFSEFQYQRTTYFPSSFGTRISTSRSVVDCASWCSGMITCYGFGFHLAGNGCIVFSLDLTAQSPIPDCASERCYHKINFLQVF